LAIPFARVLLVRFQEYVGNPSVAARDAVVAAAEEFVGWEATSRKEGVKEVESLGALAVARQQLEEAKETNRLLAALLVSLPSTFPVGFRC
jgi:hypothetical protein